LSRGGYDLLERKIMEEKTKSLHDSSTSEDVLSPHPLLVDMRNGSWLGLNQEGRYICTV